MHNKIKRRLTALVLAAATILGMGVPVQAATIDDGSKTCTVKAESSTGYSHLTTTAGTTLGATGYTYTTNDGLTGPAYCIDFGLTNASSTKALPIKGKYSASPATAGAFASGYPQLDLTTFQGLYLADNSILSGLTEPEYRSATQLAVWATLGQLGLEGTPFTSGREKLAQPSGDVAKMRIFRAAQLIATNASTWDKVYQTGMYIRLDETKLGGNVAISPDMTLEFAAKSGEYGLKMEVINGKSYYTKEYIFASATSTYYQDYTIDVWATGAPTGTIFTDLSNVELVGSSWHGTTTWRVPVENHNTNINSNGFEYWGKGKLCIPVDGAPPSGEITVHSAAQVMQYEIYLAENSAKKEQSYIIADPSKGSDEAKVILSWGGENTETGKLEVLKVGGGGSPLAGAVFSLTGTDGSSLTGTTNDAGTIFWEGLRPDITYTLTETTPPPGYGAVEPSTLTVKPGETLYWTVKDDTEHTLTVRKIDRQDGRSLQGAVIAFEQIDGSFKTSKTTDQAGYIQMNADELPIGSYKVYEVTAPEGYELDKTAQTVHWDGKEDVTLTFQDTRKITLVISKVDSATLFGLPDATFDIFKDGKKITSATTDANGLAYVSGLTSGYYEVQETIAPAGHKLDSTLHGIHIDDYDPATADDPRITIKNDPLPGLRIIKMDQLSGERLPGVTFEIYKDGALFDTKTTDENGEITLYDLEPGTYLVKEISTDDAHVVTSTPQEIELEAGRTEMAELVFFNSLKPGMHLIKVDSITMKPLPNVRFEFKLVGGSYKQELTTDINGEIDLSKLEPGTYEVRELEAPDGYLMDDAVRIVKINPDENVNLVYTNTPKPSFRLVKTSSDGTPLGGVHFRIAKIEDGTHYLDRVTDDRGEINISDLEPGVYSVKETATTSDHILDLREYHVELFPGQTSTLVIENQKRPNLTIRKTDKDTGEPIAGVTFTLRGADGPTITTEPTGPDGTVTISNLLPGVYTVIEQNVPEGYILDTTPQTVTLFANREATVQFQNYKRPTLKIAKVDINGRALTGAIFEVKTKAGVKIGDFPVGTDGTVTIPNIHLDEGYYIITEIQAPEGYILDKTPHEVYLRPGKTTEISIENEKKPGLTIYKIDSIVGDGIKGAKFKVYVSKDKTENGTYQELDSSFYYTDSNGVIHLDNLDTGWYKIVEVEPAAGFSMKEPHEQIIYVQHDASVEVTFENTPLNAIIVEKYDSVTHEALPGCTFQLRYLAGTSGTGGTVIGTKVTGKNGIAMWTGLKPGAYVVEEVDPVDGYSIINASETVYLADNGEQSVITVRFNNSPDGSLLIRKVCAVNPSTTLQDAEFKITYSDGSLIGDSNGIYRTDVNGEILIDGLKPGKSVVVTETRAPDGFIIDTQSQTIQIKEGRTVSLTFKNMPKGGIIIQKRDSITGQPLPGAEFRVATAAGCEVGLDGVIGSSTLTQNGLFTTDSNGEIRISNLAPGAYVLTETKAPSGYVMDAPSTNVVIGANGDTQTVIVTNTPKGGLIVEKYDSVTKQPLAGAVFKIMMANGELTPDNEGLTSSNGLYSTDRNGQIILSKLLPGTYVVSEETAPDNYRADPTPQTVVVNAGDTQTIRFYDDPLCTLTILKRDAVTRKPLAHATFLVRDSEGRAIGPNNGLYTTGTDGTVTVTGLTPNATIVVSETKAPTGYVKDETPKNVVVRSGVANSLIFDNEPGTTLVIRKYIEGTDYEPLAGVCFKVTDGSGAAIGPDDGTYYTDKAGEIVLDGIEPGTTVIAREIKTVEGFILDGTPQDILIKGGEAQKLTFWNKRAGELIIRKLDKLTGKPLAGVEFELVYAEGGYVDTANGHLSSNGLYYTDDHGEIHVSGITGTVVVKETRPLPGYTIEPGREQQTVTVNPQETQTLTFYNIPANTLTIQKYISGTNNEPLAGVEFLVTDSAGAVVGPNNGYYTTDKDGRISISGLTPGTTITVRETRTQDGYILDSNPQSILIKEGEAQNLTFWNKKAGGLIINKVDALTKKPLAGVKFKITYADGSNVDMDGGKISSNGLYTTNTEGQIIISGITGTIIVTELETINGYVIDPAAKSQTVQVNANDTQTITFENMPIGGLVIIKTDEETGERISGVQFEIRKLNGEIVGTYTTDRNGVISLPQAEKGWYQVTELKAAKGYRLDSQPYQVEVKDGGTATLEITNRQAGSALIHKVDSLTGEGIFGVTFLVSDAKGNPVGTYQSDNEGYVYIDKDLADGKYTVREIECAAGYILDTQPKTFYVEYGGCTTITWPNTAMRGQIQIVKKSADYNPTNGLPAGTLLEGATFEIYNERTGNKVDTIISGANGLASSKQLPLGRYTIRETKAPANYGASTETYTAVLEYSGQIVRLEISNKSLSASVSIEKTGPKEATPGQPVRYVFSRIGNTSNVMLQSFYWRDTLPAAVRLDKVVTGTYNFPGTYKIVYKVNNTGDYRTLADSLSTSQNYTLSASPTALGLAANERVTEIMFVFGQVPAGFSQVEAPMIYCTALSNLAAGSSFVNVADVGGTHNGVWVQAVSRWETKVYGKSPTLPRTGY